jgi:hypothetical protein
MFPPSLRSAVILTVAYRNHPLGIVSVASAHGEVTPTHIHSVAVGIHDLVIYVRALGTD